MKHKEECFNHLHVISEHKEGGPKHKVQPSFFLACFDVFGNQMTHSFEYLI